jgi:hypothetical protein
LGFTEAMVCSNEASAAVCCRSGIVGPRGTTRTSSGRSVSSFSLVVVRAGALPVLPICARADAAPLARVRLAARDKRWRARDMLETLSIPL